MASLDSWGSRQPRELPTQEIADRQSLARRRAGNLPYGYDYVPAYASVIPDEVRVIEEEANIIQMIFRMRAARYTLSEIADTLNETGAPRRHATNGWDKGAVRNILRQRAYYGHLQHGMKWDPKGLPSIVTRHLWDQAQHVKGVSPRARKRRPVDSDRDDRFEGKSRT